MCCATIARSCLTIAVKMLSICPHHHMRRALTECELACARPKSIASQELWCTPPRMIAFALAAGIIIVLLGMSVGAFFFKMLH